jgi:hypothetical protein
MRKALANSLAARQNNKFKRLFNIKFILINPYQTFFEKILIFIQV